MNPFNDSSAPGTPVNSTSSRDSPHAQQHDISRLPRITIQPPSSSAPPWSPPPWHPKFARKHRSPVQPPPAASSVSQYFAVRDRESTPGAAVEKDTPTQRLKPPVIDHRRKPRTTNHISTKLVKHPRSRKPRSIRRSFFPRQYFADIVLNNADDKILTWLRGFSGSPPISVDISVAEPPAPSALSAKIQCLCHPNRNID